MALPSFGTLTTFDTLQSTTQTVAQFGEDRAWDAVASLLDIFNEQVNTLTADLVDTTTNRLRRYGGSPTMKMQRLDEMGTPNAQKGRQTAIVGFPLEMYGIALQWTRKYLQTKRASEFAAQIEMATTASVRAKIGNIKVALFGGINYNFTDYLVDHLDNQFALPVKALVNADGAIIPPGPNAESFNGLTHTHYMATNGITNAWLITLVETVVEHNPDGNMMLWINRADEVSVSALADFKPMIYPGIIPSVNVDRGVGVRNPNQLNNRQIGWFRGAEVWVKPWMPASYILSWIQGTSRQPLAMRIRGDDPNGGNPIEGAGDLQLVYQAESHPLRATGWEQEYGISVWNRTSAAVGYIGGSTYVIPDYTNFF